MQAILYLQICNLKILLDTYSIYFNIPAARFAFQSKKKGRISREGGIFKRRNFAFNALKSGLRYSFNLSNKSRITREAGIKEKREYWSKYGTLQKHSSKNITDLNENLNRDLCNLKQWLQENKLSVNLIKTHAMVVGSRPNLKKISDKKVQPPTFVIDDSQIEIVEKLNIWEFNLISILFGMSMLDMCVLKYLVL